MAALTDEAPFIALHQFLGAVTSMAMTSIKIPAPPWKAFPGVHAADIWWRMGQGEDYLRELNKTLTQLVVNDRRRYLHSIIPIPEEWMLWATDLYAFPADDEESLDTAWEALTLSTDR